MCRLTIGYNVLRACEGGDFTTKFHAKNSTSIIRKIVIRSTKPPLLQARCYRMPFCLSNGVSCRISTKLSRKNTGMEREIVGLSGGWGIFTFLEAGKKKIEVFVWVGKGQALLQVLVCGLAFAGLANVLDPVRLLLPVLTLIGQKYFINPCSVHV